MWKQIGPAFRLALVLTLLTGFLYPGLVTGICQVLFPAQARGSLITHEGRVIGSALLGQRFTHQEYFHPRPSAAGSEGYEAGASGASNYGPTSRKLADRVRADVERFRKEHPDYQGLVPADLVTASASGLDPHLSPAAAEAQVRRVAQARGVAPEQVLELVRRNTQDRAFGLLGEPRVNVLALNLALDREFPRNR